MKLKRMFDNFERHILDGQVRLIQNSWARIYRIKIAARRSKNVANEDIKEIEEKLFFQCEELIRVAVEICRQIDIPLDMLGAHLAKELIGLTLLMKMAFTSNLGHQIPMGGTLHHLGMKTTLMGQKVL